MVTTHPSHPPTPTPAVADLNPTAVPEIRFLLVRIQAAAQSQFNGHLCFQWDRHAAWGLTFRHGRLVWAWAGSRRVRRLQRLLGLVQGRILAQRALIASSNAHDLAWDYELLRQLILEGTLERDLALQLIRRNMLEVLFDLLQMLSSVGEPLHVDSHAFKLEHPLKFFAPSELFVDVNQAWQAWCQAELQPYSPSLAPIMSQPAKLKAMVSEASYQNLERLLQGQLSLRDLAAQMDQDLLQLTKTLVSYERRCLIKFKAAAEPIQGKRRGGNSNPHKTQSLAPLVMGIDDSLSICRRLGQLVESAGFRYESFQSPLDGLQRAIEVKPDLIFLDLVMPVISGYELCTQIRRISELREVPVVILTGSDGILDQMRAKIAGATGFLGKPICPDEIQRMLDQHCAVKAA